MTVEKLLRDFGKACANFKDDTVRNVNAKRLRCDEIWLFVYAKAKNVTAKIAAQHPGAGDVWTWTALDADSKLVLSWLIRSRNAGTAYEFLHDVASRLRHRVQLTTDGHVPHLTAVEDACGGDVDYAMLVSLYGPDPTAEKR